jgi:hypothetical protein
MPIETNIAYLEIDPKNPIARIVFGDGNKSKRLVTKNHALTFAESMTGISLTEAEFLHIRRQIIDSKMIRNNPELEEMADKSEIEAAEIHAYMEGVREEQKRIIEENESANWWKHADDDEDS